VPQFYQRAYIDSDEGHAPYYFVSDIYTLMSAPITIGEGVWHHFARVFSGNDEVERLYIDGELVGQTSIGSWSMPLDGEWKIGTSVSPRSASWEWDGFIDDLAFYDVELDASTIRALFEGTQSPLGDAPLVGTSYCGPATDNSGGFPAHIRAYGSTAAGGQPLRLSASGLPQGQFGYFLVGPNQGFVVNPGGSSGNLCLANPLARFNAFIENSGPQAGIDVAVDTNALPFSGSPVTILPGETWNFQAWFRDGSSSNFTNGLAILFN